MRIGAVVILYHPDYGIKERILTYLPFVEQVFVFDNSEKANHEALFLDLPFRERISYHSDGNNDGISARLNQAAQLAIERQLDWLLTMDQDSFFPGENFGNLLNCLNSYHEADNVALFGIQYLDQDLQSPSCLPVKTNHLITSGSILNLSLFASIGVFDEALFIDQVDSEFCYRAILKGYNIIQFNNVYLQHSLGKSSIHRSLKSLKKTQRSLHSPIRLYYMTRNYFYMRAKYMDQFPGEIAELKEDLLVRIKNNFLYSNTRLSLIKHILAGIIDFKRKRMGKKI